jgi:putative Mg2+ transporter-C (MgtC) family protein
MNVLDLGTVYGTNIELIVKLMLAIVLGALVGFEREQKRRPAGFRTNMLVCLGSCLFTIVSVYSFSIDPARIAAGIVTGIGFLGAGSIISSGKNIQGITTAATLWVVAGVGLAVGVGEYILAIVTAVLVFFILLLKGAEKEIHKR